MARSAASDADRAATVQAIQARRESAPQPEPARREEPRAGSRPVETSASLPDVTPVVTTEFKDAFLAEVRRQKKFFYGTVIAQAQRIDVEGDRVNVVFSPQHRALRSTLEQTRPLLETIATQLAGRRMTVAASEGSHATTASQNSAAAEVEPDRKAALREQALADSGVQAMLDVFTAEIKEVEER